MVPRQNHHALIFVLNFQFFPAHRLNFTIIYAYSLKDLPIHITWHDNIERQAVLAGFIGHANERIGQCNEVNAVGPEFSGVPHFGAPGRGWAGLGEALLANRGRAEGDA